MTKELEKRMVELLKDILEYDDTSFKTKSAIKDLLESKFKEEVIEVFDDFIGYNPIFRNVLKKEELSRTTFIGEIGHRSNLVNFVEKNWEKLDTIIAVLKSYVMAEKYNNDQR